MTTKVEKAEKIINDLEEQRECLHSRTKLLSKQREQISYAAHTGDKTARQAESDQRRSFDPWQRNREALVKREPRSGGSTG
jgi:hypothetical protein